MNVNRKIHTLFVALIALSILLFPGCDRREEGSALATEGAATLEKIAEFYDMLIISTEESRDAESIFRAFTRMPFPPEQQATFDKQASNLRKRAQLARSFSDTFKTLGKLAEYNASAEVKESTTKLAKEIQTLPKMSADSIDPSKIFGMIAGDLMALKQSKDLRRGAVLIRDALSKYQLLFDNEIEVYKGIAVDRYKKFNNVAYWLFHKNLVQSSGLLNPSVSALGLSIDMKKADADPDLMRAVESIARGRAEKMMAVGQMAAHTAQRDLSKLAATVDRFIAKRPFTLSEGIQLTAELQKYLEEIESLRKAKKEE
ncbi:MAG: hypothetical protein KF881_02975 [Acidobacteria bacterium]|nr:hypothetical protein [Acidobacteriota bacterium]